MGLVFANVFGHINENGELRIYDRELFLSKIAEYKNTRIVMSIEKREGDFTSQQRKYYFSVLVRELQKAFWSLGYNLTQEEVDTKMRERFLYKEYYDPKQDKWIREIHRLNNQESEVTYTMFTNFIESCIRFAAQHLDWSIAYPNEILEREDFTDNQIKTSINHLNLKK